MRVLGVSEGKEGVHVRKNRNNVRMTPENTRLEGPLATVFTLANVWHSRKGRPRAPKKRQKLC